MIKFIPGVKDIFLVITFQFWSYLSACEQRERKISSATSITRAKLQDHYRELVTTIVKLVTHFMTEISYRRITKKQWHPSNMPPYYTALFITLTWNFRHGNIPKYTCCHMEHERFVKLEENLCCAAFCYHIDQCTDEENRSPKLTGKD